MKKFLFKIFTVSTLFFISSPLFANISFDNIDVNENDEVLYTINQQLFEGESYNSLVYTKLQNGTHQSTHDFITCFPEQMELLNDKKTLQIRNKYGVAKYDLIANKMNWVSKVKSIPETTLPLSAYSVSNNGEWYCYLESTGDVKASLILKNTKTGKEKTLCTDILMDYEKVPVKWAPDSSVLLYENHNNIYFCNPEAYLKGIEVDEKNRKIGRGSINSVNVVSDKYFAYVDDYLLYKISFKELYTLGLYSGIIGQGTIVGRLPFPFNPKTDKFSVNKPFTGVFLIQNNRMFSYLNVKSESCDYMDVLYSRPYTDTSATLKDAHVFWDKSNSPILWQEKLPYDKTFERGSVFKISTVNLQVLEVEDSGTPFISPDASKIAFYAGEGLYVYDVSTWKRIGHLSGERITKLLWLDSNTLIVGGTKSIKKWNLLSNETFLLTLSSCKAGYWNPISGKIICNNNSGDDYEYEKESRTWKRVGLSTNRVPVTQNGRYRVFVGNAINSNFENSIYVRTLTSKPTTKVLYSQTRKKIAPKKKIALIFDAYDNSDGLSKVITTLNKYDINPTFFINGEFIKRYPSETKQISIYNFDCASMFFSAIDLTDNTFVIDEDFIRRGLARNEDEFYQITKKELSLFWHTPFFVKNQMILSAGEKTGYIYVGIPEELLQLQTNNANDNIENLLSKYINCVKENDETVLPIQIGYSSQENKTLIYQHLDILICTLLKNGYEFVTINKI